MGDAALGDLDIGSAKIFLTDLLADGGLDQGWARREQRGLLGHDRKVHQRGGQGTVSRSGPRHDADGRNDAREIDETLEIIGRATMALEGVGDSVSGTLQNKNQRHSLVPGQLGEAIAFVRRTEPDRTAHHCKIFGAHENGPTLDGTEAGGKGVGRGSFAHPTHQSAEFLKAAGIQQSRDALPSVELAATALFLELFAPSHGPSALPAFLEIGKKRLPIVRLARLLRILGQGTPCCAFWEKPKGATDCRGMPG